MSTRTVNISIRDEDTDEIILVPVPSSDEVRSAIRAMHDSATYLTCLRVECHQRKIIARDDDESFFSAETGDFDGELPKTVDYVLKQILPMISEEQGACDG